MKKILLCTSTLAMTNFAGSASAVEVAAGTVNLEIGGFFISILGVASVDGPAGTDFDGADVFTTSEIIFKPSIKLDNGITVGAEFQLEGNTASDQIDESFFYVKGGFGEIIIGSENSAGYKLTKSAPDVSFILANSTSITAFVPFSGTAGGNNTGDGVFRQTLGATFIENDGSNDAQRLTYFTPNFNGFKAGISYARDGGEGNGPVNNNDATVGITDIIAIAASYDGTLAGVDVGLSARYGIAEAAGGVGSDPELWGGGINIGYNGFTIGGSYAEQDGTVNSDGRAYDVGIGYSQGCELACKSDPLRWVIGV